MMLLGVLVAGALLGWTWCAHAATSMVEWLSFRASVVDVVLSGAMWVPLSIGCGGHVDAWLMVLTAAFDSSHSTTIG